ncbi:MAG: thioredoxin [Flavobacteriaceae bacterium]
MAEKFNALINSERPVLVDFFATWCGPCKMLGPILEQVKDELGETVRIVKIDVDKNQGLATKFQVRGVPTLLIFKKGEQLWRQSGVMQKNDLVGVLQQFI